MAAMMATEQTKHAGKSREVGDASRRGPIEDRPEPLVVPGSLSQRLGHAAVGFLFGVVLCTAYDHVERDKLEDHYQEQAADRRQDSARAEDDAQVTTTLAQLVAPVEPTCPPEEGSSVEPVREFTDPPPMCIDPARRYVATVETTRGEFEITLDAEATPITVNNFVFLARWRYYQGAGFHFALPGRVIHGGDPVGGLGGGRGDPGYSIENEPPAEEPYYPELSVAMDRDPYEPDRTASHFFVVTGSEYESTAPYYSRFGHITAGEDVIHAIETTGDPTTGEIPDDQLTVIERITIDEQR
jgi:cyclophilin family peptidyl-prolyl cis-trans isomerase